MINMSNDEIIEKWLSVFGANITEKIMTEHVRNYGNLMWHIFTWGNVPCAEGDEARKLIDKQSSDEVIIFKNGHSSSANKIRIDDVKICAKITSEELENIDDDVYVTDTDFQWTYVKTHEYTCGPYFCVRVI